MSDAIRTGKFTWGDSVQVRPAAPPEFRPGDYAAVCGIREPEETFPEHRYLIEYDDGFSVEIPERHLAEYESSKDTSREGHAKA